MRPLNITAAHLERRALIYLRQSSGFQVEHHTGSTARQYQLQNLAADWGWAADRIVVIDDDLGVSGTGTRLRTGFRDMLALITSGQVGAGHCQLKEAVLKTLPLNIRFRAVPGSLPPIAGVKLPWR